MGPGVYFASTKAKAGEFGPVILTCEISNELVMSGKDPCGRPIFCVLAYDADAGRISILRREEVRSCSVLQPCTSSECRECNPNKG